jgi:hypothetical protein
MLWFWLKFEKRGDKDFLILGLNKLVVFNIICFRSWLCNGCVRSIIAQPCASNSSKKNLWHVSKFFVFSKSKIYPFFFKKNYWFGFLYFVVFRDFKQLIKAIQMCCWVACDRNTLAFLITKWSVMRLYWLLKVFFLIKNILNIYIFLILSHQN